MTSPESYFLFRVLLFLISLFAILLHSARSYVYFRASAVVRGVLVPAVALQQTPLSPSCLPALLLAAAAASTGAILLLPVSFPFDVITRDAVPAYRRAALSRVLQLLATSLAAVETALAFAAFCALRAGAAQTRHRPVSDVDRGAEDLADAMHAWAGILGETSLAALVFFSWGLFGFFALTAEEMNRAAPAAEQRDDVELAASPSPRAGEVDRWHSVDLGDESRARHDYVFSQDTGRSVDGLLSK